ncbi:protocadherin Fat 4-like [Varroa jacobsoni]|uniref:Cadherin domain-containing protein n=1 Tax=Varroa destructor TaxID=109461 RepID=A0A7M7J6X7_VARDE|nr:protocadherin Fat 4-like [Varroa destructor]XP_022704733.1 protocadherin Fat 4-like [Varroa jacobsoni]
MRTNGRNVVLRLLLILAAAGVHAQEKDNNLCYLSSGASSVTFTVSEDFRIGGEIGVVQVFGELGKGITLTIENTDAVTFRNKSLILQKQLDKEGDSGLRDISAEALCTPQNDLSISIPIKIIVTDVNDNAPVFQATPYVLNVSEATVPGSVVSQGLIRAVDADQPGSYSTVEYFIERSEHSKYVAFESSLDGTLTLVEKLDYETVPSFNVTIRAQDQGNPPMVSRTNLTIHVLDADDQNPRFLHERYLLNLPPEPKLREPLDVLPSRIQATDPDEGIRAPIKYSLSSNKAEYSYFDIDPYSGQVTLARKLPANTQLPIVLVIRATQRNDEEKFSLTTLTVASSEFLPHELKFFQREYTVPLVESTPPGQVILRLQTTKSTEKNLKFQLVEADNERSLGTFSIGTKGEVYLQKSIDYEIRREYILTAFVSDGKDRDLTKINITVLNANDNDPVFEFPQYTFIMPVNAKPGELVGKVKCTDGDRDDQIGYSLEGPNSNAFYINDRGEIRLKNMDQVNITSHMVIVATDNGVPPRKSTSLVTIRLPEVAAASGLFRNSALILPAAFGVILGILVLIIITMVFYILKNKKYRNHLPVVIDGNGLTGHGPLPPRPTIEPHKVNTPKKPPGVENPMFASEREDTWSTSEQEVAHEGFQRLVTRPAGNSRTPRLPISGSTSRIQWPLGSIPRRVKKLSWEDEFANETALDPDVSVAPYHQQRQNPKDITVYF